MTKEALTLALEALKQIDAAMPFPVAKLAIKKAEEALSSPNGEAQPEQCTYPDCNYLCMNLPDCKQPEQKPVAWISPKELLVMRGNAYAGAKNWRVNLGLEPEEGDVGLYTTPQPAQKPWVGLTDEEFKDAINDKLTPECIAIAVEAKLREKNT